MRIFRITAWRRGLCLATALVSSAVGTARADEIVDLQLVLAIDASDSVDAREYRLQLQSTANDFRDPVIVQAI